MSIIFKTTEVFTDLTLPTLQRDYVATLDAGVLDSFDTGDKYSYPKQSAPIAGTDYCKSLITANTASFTGTVGFSGGFTTDGGSDAIVLPNTFKPATITSNGLVVVWVKPGTQTDTTHNYNVFAAMDAVASDAPYAAYVQSGNSIIFTVKGGYISGDSITPGVVVQYGISFQIINGVYVAKVFKNGALKASVTTALATLTSIPTSNPMLAGAKLSPNNYFIGTFYRTLYDNLTVKTPEDIIALDYATNVGRFV